MTEEEARAKWCPMAGASRFARQDEMCIASACMAWRWESESYEQRHTSVKGVRRSITHGHCGLAGTDK